MSHHFSRALARTPGKTFVEGLTSAALGLPEQEKALKQHSDYCSALADAGVHVTLMYADNAFPDSTFVEDTAVVAKGRAIITRPGAESRAGETAAIRLALEQYINEVASIEPPGTLDGGDVCESDDCVFIGISHRTNQSGAEQLAAWLRRAGVESAFVDIRDLDGILHLKSGMSYIGDGIYVVDAALRPRLTLGSADVIVPEPSEAYAANCVRVNDVVLFPSGYPKLEAAIEERGLRVVPLEVSEFRKMDGGLSCLSIRF